MKEEGPYKEHISRRATKWDNEGGDDGESQEVGKDAVTGIPVGTQAHSGCQIPCGNTATLVKHLGDGWKERKNERKNERKIEEKTEIKRGRACEHN